MTRFLVTGGMGFVGSHLCEGLLARGYEVCAIDLFAPPFARKLQGNDRFRLVVDSIMNREVLQRLVDDADVVCHLAAIASPEEYVVGPRRVMDITLLAALDLIGMMRGTGKKLFFTSTSEIYGKNLALPFKEDDDRVLGSTEVNRWCYSTSKSALEHYVKACHQAGELDYQIVRLFNVYGPRLTGRVVNRFVDAALTGNPLIVHGNGSQTRCFTWVGDATDAFIRLMEAEQAWNNTYNVGTDVETSILDLAKLTMRLMALPRERLRFVTHESAIGASYEDIGRRVPDPERIWRTIGWRAQTPLADGLKMMLDARRRELAAGEVLMPKVREEVTAET